MRESQTYLKCVFKISSTCSNVSLKTWTSLYRWPTDHPVEIFPLFDQMLTSVGQRHESVCGTFSYSFLRSSRFPGGDQNCWLGRVGATKSSVSRINGCTVLSGWMWVCRGLKSHLTLYRSLEQEDFEPVTYQKLRYFVVDIFLKINCSTTKNIFQPNFVVLSDIFVIHCT